MVITSLDLKGNSISDSIKIANCFNRYFVQVGSDIENKIPIGKMCYKTYMKNIRINNSLFYNQQIWRKFMISSSH